MSRLAMVTGSFDPITIGHMDVIRRAAALFDEVIVVIAQNEEKTYMFSTEERVELAKLAVSELPNVSVEVCDGLVAPFAAERGAVAFVRGIRGEEDTFYEQDMAARNFEYAGLETVVLFSKPEFSGISSTKARAALSAGESAAAFLPEAVERLAGRFYAQKRTKR